MSQHVAPIRTPERDLRAVESGTVEVHDPGRHRNAQEHADSAYFFMAKADERFVHRQPEVAAHFRGLAQWHATMAIYERES